MKAFCRTVLATASALVCGCGGNNNQAPCDPCEQADAATVNGAATQALNPDGLAYPSPAGGYGHAARTGAVAGSVIQNFKFSGYVNANMAMGLQTIALSDYYDPCVKRYKLLHLSVAGVWCTPCNEETDAIVADKAGLDADGVIVLQALSDGPTEGLGATVGDLQMWIKTHGSNFTEMLDPNLTNFGTFFTASEIPWNADVDPRTMEILDEGTGWNGSGEYSTELAVPLAQVKDPAKYPVPTCN
jgi:hypothetical protein